MTERMSMREASKVLGVSQIRVRELIRKGTLHAEKIVVDGTDRWAILPASVHDYLTKRPPRPDGQLPSNTPAPNLGVLINGLEEHLKRIRVLIREITSAQSYLDGLRAVQNTMESELATLRAVARDTANTMTIEPARQEDTRPRHHQPTLEQKPDVPEPPKAEKPKEQTPKTEKLKAEKPKAGKPKAKAAKSKAKASEAKSTAEKPKASPKQDAKKATRKKAPDTKARSAPDTALGAALREAGVDAKPSKKPKGGGKKKS